MAQTGHHLKIEEVLFEASSQPPTPQRAHPLRVVRDQMRVMLTLPTQSVLLSTRRKGGMIREGAAPREQESNFALDR